MHERATLRRRLEELKRVLQQNDEGWYAGHVENALSGPEEDFLAFLVSNELWGGAGSIADQAGVEQGREVRRLIEAALIEAGKEQIQSGLVNPRTTMWVDAFQQWQRDGI